MREPLSVVLITKNAAHSWKKPGQRAVGRRNRGGGFGQYRQTVAIASAYKAKVIHQDWLGFGPQKQFAVQAASHDWVLCLDADEWPSAELVLQIKKILNNPQAVPTVLPAATVLWVVF
jgi:hypothetical protein